MVLDLAVDEPTTGEWCAECALPSAVRTTGRAFRLGEEGLTVAFIYDCTECDRCGHRWT